MTQTAFLHADVFTGKVKYNKLHLYLIAAMLMTPGFSVSIINIDACIVAFMAPVKPHFGGDACLDSLEINPGC